MAWTDTARRQHMRNERRYPSDLRDGEWALIEPMFPAARGGGRPRTTCLRAVKRPGFSGGSLVWIMQPYRGSQGLHSNWLQPLRAGCIRWGQRGGGC